MVNNLVSYERTFKVKYYTADKYINGVGSSKEKVSCMGVYENGRLINAFSGYNADDILKILTGEESMKNLKFVKEEENQ